MFEEVHKEAMAEIMQAGGGSYRKEAIVEDFLVFLGGLFDYEYSYFIELGLSPSPQAIMVEMPDYSATYPLEKMTDGSVDYTDFISRYLY